MTRIQLGVMLLALTLMGVAFSQDKDKDKDKKTDDPPPKLKGTLPPHFKKLGLRDDQVQKIYKLKADYRAKIEDLNKRIAKLKGEEKEALEKVLTPEQLKRLKELRSGEKPSEK
jgi:Spy/CpxP family protein refolding chaperone